MKGVKALLCTDPSLQRGGSGAFRNVLLYESALTPINIKMKAVARFFQIYSGIGFFTTLVLHVISLNREFDTHKNFPYLFFFLFPMWIVFVIIAQKATETTKRRDFWKVILKFAPTWMKRLCYISFAYAILNFIYFILNNAFFSNGRGFNEARLFTGHLLPFFAAACTGFTSFCKAPHSLHSFVPICQCGNKLSANDEFCSACGLKKTNPDNNELVKGPSRKNI